MNIRLVEPITLNKVSDEKGQSMYRVRPIAPDSPKHQAVMRLLGEKPCPEFLRLGEWLINYLRNTGFPCLAPDTLEGPLCLMTDFTDPRPLKGLRIETSEGVQNYPDLYFLGFYTDWDNLAESGVVDIFGHEYAHLWFYLLNFDSSLMRSNKFHTVTAVTDPFTAFFEGFAEHLQIVTEDLAGRGETEELWDCALDTRAWLCRRDQQLRSHAVKNNRFVYQTALPGQEEFSNYVNLHMAHLTSSAFTPEKLKNGSQVAASEGAVASVFYHIYSSPVFKNHYCSAEFYSKFGAIQTDVGPVQNLYLKIFHTLSKMDFQRPCLLSDFIRVYGECFPLEREALFKLFLELTHFTTVSPEAAGIFGDFCRIGRRGVIEDFKKVYLQVRAFKEDLTAKVLAGVVPLDEALYPQIWITGDERIPPVPWEPGHLAPYEFDLNTASEVDLLALARIDLERARQITAYREENRGFKSLEDFQRAFPSPGR